MNVQQIKNEYNSLGRFFNTSAGNLYNYFQDMVVEREKIKFLSGLFGKDIMNKKVLDVGAGTGEGLLYWLRWNIDPQNLFAVELSENRCNWMRALYPFLKVRLGSAEDLSFVSNKFFDVIQQSTAFSAMDEDMQEKVAKEMLRVLADDGFILWFDAFDTYSDCSIFKAINKDRIKELFPNCDIIYKRVILKFSIIKRTLKRSWILTDILHSLRIFNTHYVCLIRKRVDKDGKS